MAKEAEQAEAQATPMMAQYLEIKAANMDCLLFYRMGDFFEMFFEDAEQASQAVGLTLTTRGTHMGKPIPMCGVPVRTADDYLQKLIKAGFKIAVCEQTEDPREARKRGNKAVVRRDVVRLVTPGTITEDNLLETDRNNYLTALYRSPAGDGRVALASLDISTGDFEVDELPETDLMGELIRLSPREILVSEREGPDAVLRAAADSLSAVVNRVPAPGFDSRTGAQMLKKRLGVDALEGFGSFGRFELSAVAALLRYVELTQVGRFPVLRPPRRRGPAGRMVIDAATRINLELLTSLKGERDLSLLGAIDRTITKAGARELAARLAGPLLDIDEINARLDAVSFLVEDTRLRGDLRDGLRRAPDMARAIARLAVGRGGPRDLGALRNGLATAAQIVVRLGAGIGLPQPLGAIADRLRALDGELGDLLIRALTEELPINARDGAFVRTGFRPELDQLRRLRDESRQVLAELQTRYAAETEIKSLKVKHNNVLGYFVEVTAANAERLMRPPLSANFQHRQTLANAVRFTTLELSEAEQKILTAGERALAIEQEVFDELCAAVLGMEQPIGAAAAALGELDVYCGLALLAEEEGLVRPVVDDSLSLEIEGGRHPVVERALKRAGEGPFIENDCLLTAGAEGNLHKGRLWVITGPNMAGKSTFLRQNALIAVLAQSGCFVPARRVRIGLVDRLFSRVGASDDLARGRSTFMVEMVETAAILNQAAERALVILDEIGRGTATFDGLSIAWATVEHLHEVNRCRALFATHYHELTALTARLMHAVNVTVEVREWKDEIIFLHKVKFGTADRSYGIQVARLAGLPAPVIERASEVLDLLEKAEDRRSPEELVDDLPLFAVSRPKSVHQRRAEETPLFGAVEALQPDQMTPREALEALYRLKELLDEGE